MHKLFSVDDHIIEPPNVWVDRVPAKFRESAPHVVEADGRQYWEFENKRVQTMGLNAVAGRPRSEWGNEPLRYDDMILGCYDPKQRAEDMRSNGIFASVNFPTLPRFGGARFLDFDDKDLASVCVQAWNDFVIDEWCAAAPDMFVPMTLCQLWDPELAAREVLRCAAKGSRALCFVEDPSPLGLPSVHTDAWDPLWAACQETDLPICMHIASSGASQVGETDEPGIVQIAAAFTYAAHASVNLLLSPVLNNFPDLKMVWSEGGIGWVPAALERADRQFTRHKGWTEMRGPLPSELCRRNMWFCMIEEPVGLTFREHVGVDHILWECDFPHADTTWPDSQAIVDELFADVPQQETDMITYLNAASLFKWPIPA